MTSTTAAVRPEDKLDLAVESMLNGLSVVPVEA